MITALPRPIGRSADPITGEDGEDGIPAVLPLRPPLFNSNLFFDWRLWLRGADGGRGVRSVLAALHSRIDAPITEVDRATERIAQGQFDVHAPDGRQMSSAIWARRSTALRRA